MLPEKKSLLRTNVTAAVLLMISLFPYKKYYFEILPKKSSDITAYICSFIILEIIVGGKNKRMCLYHILDPSKNLN